MKKQLYILFILFIFSGSLLAQDPLPSPTAQPKDIQKTGPENLKGVPEIAPDFKKDSQELPDLGRVGVDMLDQKPIALREVLVLALENNKDIEVSRQNTKLAEFDLQSASGFFDPRISGQSFLERSTTPNISIFGTNRTTTQNNLAGNLSFQGFIKKYGSNYAVSFGTQRTSTNSQVATLTPQFNTNIGINFTQPLLRGRKSDNQRRVIEIAKKNLSLSDTQFRQKSIDTIVSVQRAYWDLTFALRNLQVQRDSVRDAKEQLAHNRRLRDEGAIAPVDVLAAETQVANLEVAVYDALEGVNRAENVLKTLIASDKNDRIWGVSLVPTDPVENEPPPTTLPEALGIALQNRPELEINDAAKEINEIDRKFFREQRKPQIDLFASYTSNGISGKENPDRVNFSNSSTALLFNQIIGRLNPLTPNLPGIPFVEVPPSQGVSTALTGNYFSSLTDVFAQCYPTIRFGISFNFSLGNRATEAQLGRSLVKAEKLKTQREQLEQAIQADVRNALQSLRTAEARLRSASIARENSQKQYDSERRKFDEGFSDIYRVLERQTLLMNARSAELRSQTELNKAIAELQRATGNSLKANNVEAKLRR